MAKATVQDQVAVCTTTPSLAKAATTTPAKAGTKKPAKAGTKKLARAGTTKPATGTMTPAKAGTRTTETATLTTTPATAGSTTPAKAGTLTPPPPARTAAARTQRRLLTGPPWRSAAGTTPAEPRPSAPPAAGAHPGWAGSRCPLAPPPSSRRLGARLRRRCGRRRGGWCTGRWRTTRCTPRQGACCPPLPCRTRPEAIAECRCTSALASATGLRSNSSSPSALSALRRPSSPVLSLQRHAWSRPPAQATSSPATSRSSCASADGLGRLP
mmetsp:Transcript_36124/g.82312  ORF Transcript_36124/g.82312 Transcript_36124/m.82312 type:complete len:270 (+) Transcript_36124:374-1183(+)